MGNLTGILPDAWMEKAAKDLAPRPVEEQIFDAMAQAGVTGPESITIDGEIHRYKTTGKDKSGWYIFYADNIVAGSFGDWKTGVEQNFCQNTGRKLSADEQAAHQARISQARQAREQERQEQYKAVSESVEDIWNRAQPASADHPYLTKKGIQPHGARLNADGRLIVPLFDNAGVISSLQYIGHDSAKLYHKGGKTSACYNIIGTPTKSIYIAEGFATAASIHEATGQAVAVAYSASNLPKVAEILAPLIPHITIVADNDESGVGLKYADQASAKFGCAVIMPPTPGDANDFQQGGGDLKALLATKTNDWLISANDFLTDFKPVSWLVKGVIPKSSSIMLFGPSGAGKSFLLIDWMMHVATGKAEWQGRKIRHGQVAYLAGEGHHGIKGRIKAWMQENGEGVDDIKLHISKSACDINTREGINKVLLELQALPEPPVLIVIDTVNRFLDGDENSAQDVRGFMNACDSIRQSYPDSSNIFVHHTGVSQDASKRARGSSAWKASMEVELLLTPCEFCITLSQEKAKDGKAMTPFHFTLEDVVLDGIIDEDGDPVTSAKVVKADAPEPEKKPEKLSKIDKHLTLFTNAFKWSGGEFQGDRAYISKAAMVRYMVEVLEMSPKSAQQTIKPSANGKVICDLLQANIIQASSHGWVLMDQVLNSSLLLQRPLNK